MNFSSELLNKGNKTPAFSISIEGRDITTVLDKPPDESDADG